MKKVFQTKFGKEGNCFSACIASILELSIDDVPCFLEDAGMWYFNYQQWARKHNLDLVGITEWGKETIGFIPQVYSIVSGLGPRGLQHSTVYFGNEMVHDPHPEEGGVKDITDWIYIVSKYPKIEE